MTKPKYVVRRGSLGDNLYLQKNGAWGPYKTAKRFKDMDECPDNVDGDTNIGIFPCSVPKKRGEAHES